MDGGADSIGIQNQLLACDVVYNEKRAFLSLKSEARFEISLVVSGVGIHRVLDKDIPCKAGDMFIIPSGVPHGYFLESAEDQLVHLRAAYDALG